MAAKAIFLIAITPGHQTICLDQQLQDPQLLPAFRLEEMENPLPLGVLT
jgi:hypothetical protein